MRSLPIMIRFLFNPRCREHLPLPVVMFTCWKEKSRC